MQRIPTEEEFKKLNKKQRYCNVNKGIRRANACNKYKQRKTRRL